LAALAVLVVSTAFLPGCSKGRMRVTANPEDVEPGGIVRISGPLERISLSGDKLRYRFDASAGSFSGGYAESTPAAVWTAPPEPGRYLLSVVALDGESALASGQITVTVRNAVGRRLNVEYEAPPQVTLGGSFSERKTLLDELWRE